MALTNINVCNAALAQIGSDVVISALNDTTTREARKCNLFYPIALAELQELFPWNYVKKRARLVRDGGYFDLTDQLTNPIQVVMRPNGLQFYALAGTTVYQYSTDEAYDITDASYDSKSFSFSTEEATPTGIAFNAAGTKMYMVGTTDKIVEQYSLSTPWDVSTATADAVQLNVSAQDTSPQGMVFANSGLKLYIVGDTNNSIFEYTLTTAYSLATASYASKTISVAVQDTSPRGVAFNADGTKMYVSGSQSDAIHQYTLSTAYDVSTATTDSVDFQLVDTDNVLMGLVVVDSGMRIIAVGQENDYVYSFGMEIAYDLSTANALDPESGFDYQFTIPADCYRVLKVTISTQVDEPEWELEGRRVQIDEDSAVDIVYIAQQTDNNYFTALFQKALIFNLASYLAMALANDSQLKALMIAERDLVIGKAEQMTDREGNPDEEPKKTRWQKRGRYNINAKYPEVL